MNREDIIRMANEAGIIHPEMVYQTIERFAALVASAERERIKQANAPEIELVNAHIKELEDACKKPEHEPVAWYRDENGIRIYYETKCWDDAIPLYTAPQPWEKFCDSNCVWTDHHPDCKLAEQHQDWCASLTQMLMSMPPKPAPCNCKPKPLPWTNKISIDVPNQPLYTAPHKWVGLTFDERLELAEDVDWPAGAYCEYAEKIEAKLKELNT